MFDKEEEIGVVRPNGPGNGTNGMESSADATPYPASSLKPPHSWTSHGGSFLR